MGFIAQCCDDEIYVKILDFEIEEAEGEGERIPGNPESLDDPNQQVDFH